MNRFPVCPVAELPPGSKKIVSVSGRSIGIYHVNDEYYAIRNVCPHQGAELCAGITTSLITSNAPGQFCFEREGEIVRCPWHFWEFDLKTGLMIVDPTMRTKTYNVSVEKYDVSTDKEYVYVHV